MDSGYLHLLNNSTVKHIKTYILFISYKLVSIIYNLIGADKLSIIQYGGVCVQMRYLPVQRGLVTIKCVHDDEKFTILFLQECSVFTLFMKVFYDFHDGHFGLLWRKRVFGSQIPEGSKWKFDDELQILNKEWQGNGVSHGKLSKTKSSTVRITGEKEPLHHLTTRF